MNPDEEWVSPTTGSLKAWVGGALAGVRNSTGKSRAAFWRPLGVPPSTALRHEAGIHTPDLDAMRTAMDAVGVDVVVTFKKRVG